MGRLSEAERIEREVVVERKNVGGPKHIDTLKAAESYALILHRLERYSEAEVVWREVMEGREQLGGLRDEETLRVKLSYGVTLQEDKELKAAKQVYLEVIKAGEESLGSGHWLVKEALENYQLIG